MILQAAARHQCSYLVNLHVNDFLQVGGDPKWLNGLDEAPQKLQQLGELNKILAHRPWLLTKEHIEVRGRVWRGRDIKSVTQQAEIRGGGGVAAAVQL